MFHTETILGVSNQVSEIGSLTNCAAFFMGGQWMEQDLKFRDHGGMNQLTSADNQ